MIVNEPLARAIIKRHIKVVQRRQINSLAQGHNRKSRKHFVRHIVDNLSKIGLVVDIDVDGNMTRLMCLMDSDGLNLNFVMVTINTKKCTFRSMHTPLSLSAHVICRMLQYYRTDNLQDIKAGLGSLFKFMTAGIDMENNENIEDIRKYAVYAKGFGKLVVENFDNILVVKTFIKADSLIGKNLRTYQTATDDNCAIEKWNNEKS